MTDTPADPKPFQRHFVFLANTAWTSSEIQLNDLPGSGRIDEACRAINSGIWLSHALREHVKVTVILKGRPDPPLSLTFDTNKLRYVRPDERSTGGFIKKALEHVETYGTAAFAGLTITANGLAGSLHNAPYIYWLDGGGKDLLNVAMPQNPVFVIGDHKGIYQEDKKVLKKHKARKVSIGPQLYMGAHCISFLNIYLDRLAHYRVMEHSNNSGTQG